MTLDEYRRKVGWSITSMARAAGIDNSTLRKALVGKEKISPTTAQRLAQAISKAMGQHIIVDDIDGLNINY